MITLSNQQVEICRLAAQGLSIKQIAGALDVSDSTIRTQRTRIMKKLSANSFAQVTTLFEASLSVKSTTKNGLKIDIPDITLWYNNSNGKVFARQIFRE